MIGTDPVRLETNDEAVQQAGSSSFFGYPQTYGTDQDCGPPHALGAGAPAKRLQPRLDGAEPRTASLGLQRDHVLVDEASKLGEE